ncbi:MAG: MFS transporter [Acidobacteriota bacterium]|nr:MFS transporter [Acidobacteriota bacterium]
MTTPRSPEDSQLGIPPQPPREGYLVRVSAAFRHRDFRVIWWGALVSTIGTWMQKYAQSWLVLSLTGSTFYLGLDELLNQLPIILFTLIGGVIADRHDRRRLLVGSQLVQALSAFCLAVLVWTGRIEIWHVLALSFVSGCGQAFGGPAYQSLIPSLVPRKDMPNAIALNSIQFNLSRVLGPMLGTPVLLLAGAAGCFFLNGLSFFVVIAALVSLHIVHTPQANPARIMEDLKGGLRYMRDEPALRMLTVLVFLSTFFALPLVTFLPVFARDILAGPSAPETKLSGLMAAQGLGAIGGALIVAGLGTFRRMGRTLLWVQIGFGGLIALFAITRSLPVSYFLLFIGGAAFMTVFSLSSSLVQLTVPDHLRGRVMSIFMLALRGGGPLGAFASGAAASYSSVSSVLVADGILLSVVAAYFLIRSHGIREL